MGETSRACNASRTSSLMAHLRRRLAQLALQRGHLCLQLLGLCFERCRMALCPPRRQELLLQLPQLLPLVGGVPGPQNLCGCRHEQR